MEMEDGQADVSLDIVRIAPDATAGSGRTALIAVRLRDVRPIWIGFGAVAAIVGIWVRCWQLASQIIVDDEWHAIQKLLTSNYADIASHFGLADYCIPLTLYFKFCTLHGGLAEWDMRWPMLLCGAALIFVAPLMLRRQTSPPTLAVWMGLIAISPMMTYHSRIARPYAITTLLVFIAVMAFREWHLRDDKRLRWAALYVVCASLAGWLHLVTLPFTLLPFVFFGAGALRDIVRRRDSQRWKTFGSLFALGLITAALLAAALVPPFIGDANSLASKSGTGYLSPNSVYRTLLVSFGISSVFLFGAMSAMSVSGFAAWWRRDRSFAAYIATIALGGAIAIGILRPAWVQNPATFARYLQPIIPFLLLFIAERIALALAQISDVPRAAIAALALIGLFFAGPMPEYLYNPNQFMAHAYFQFDYDPSRNLIRTTSPAGSIPDFYSKLSAQPPRSLTLIEAPWSLRSNFNPQELYQAAHRQMVRIGFVGSVCGSPGYGEFTENSGIHLDHFVHLTGLLSGAAAGDFLVMHRQAWPSPRNDFPDVPACLPTIQAKLGAPVYDDGDLAVFALTPLAAAVAKTLH